jgi:ACT domain-containing protein
MTTDPERSLRLKHLRALIDALDIRAPHIERPSEIAITHDAANLRKKALQRIAELEVKK